MSQRTTLTILLGTLLSVGLVTFLLPAAAAPFLSETPLELVIYSADGSEVVGHSSYHAISRPDGTTEIQGEAHYLSGEFDIERDQLSSSQAGRIPTLRSFRHDFYAADGRREFWAWADVKTGAASCAGFDGDSSTPLSRTLDFPADVYAGASLIVPLEYYLRRGVQKSMAFTDFVCIPGPRIIAIQANVDPNRTRWVSHPGNLTCVVIKPDFGWIGFLAAPFLPKFVAWFDSANDWSYVGGRNQRYYKGPAIQLVRKSPVRERLIDANKPGAGPVIR